MVVAHFNTFSALASLQRRRRSLGYLATQTAHEEDEMIARVWHGRIRAQDTQEYIRYIEATGLRDYRSCAGNRGALMLTRANGPEAEVYTISLWDSIDAVRGFAGNDVAKARYYPEDKRYLLEFEETVQHFNVIGELEALNIVPQSLL